MRLKLSQMKSSATLQKNSFPSSEQNQEIHEASSDPDDSSSVEVSGRRRERKGEKGREREGFPIEKRPRDYENGHERKK